MNSPYRTAARISTFLFIGSLGTNFCLADGAVVDKIYHPYVDALEQEIEYRLLWQDEQPGADDRTQLHRLSYGRALGERWFGEFYLIGERSENEHFSLEAYEIELKWQLSEQGEYAVDWGLLFELEKEADENIWEFSTGLLLEKEWGRWSTTANLLVTHEWGHDIEDETETALGLQLRKRWARHFEPALEFYAGEDTRALGPVLLGDLTLGIRRSLHWEIGLLFGLDQDSPDHSLRLLLEFEW